MEPLRLKHRPAVEEAIENWDDDDFMIDNDGLTLRSVSTTATNHAKRRESRRSSFRSDRDSLAGDDERHVHLPGDDEKSTADAIAAATNAGIPIPSNVPPSALMGGTIKRLGGRRIKRAIQQEDWDDDLVLPDTGEVLKVKPRDSKQFPDILRHVSGSTTTSPVKVLKTAALEGPARKATHPLVTTPSSSLDKFRDTDDDDFFDDGSVTIKAPKIRPPSKPVSLVTPPTPQKQKSDEDSLEAGLELPSSGKLQLTSRPEAPKTPAISSPDDFDWGEGSLGTRYGGTKRDTFSNRSSSVSAFSPSISSSITAESEDETFDGLVLPNGPLDLGERLKHRRVSSSPVRPDPMKRPESPKRPSPPVPAAEDDPLDGLDLGDGDLLGLGKLHLHRNIKFKETRPTSPARPKAAVSITFTSKPPPSASGSRLPRPMVSHERSLTQPSLEPVSESGGPIWTRPARRSQSRLSHSTHSSISSIATPSTPSPSLPPPPARRRELNHKTSIGTLRNDVTTTSAQLLRLKRSLPAMRAQALPQSPAPRLSGPQSNRPPSRTDRSQPSLRPKTPTERSRPFYEGSAAQARKNPVPFLPAGASHAQSQHIAAKSSRTFRRWDSDSGPEMRPQSRTVSRSTIRSPSPRKHRDVGKVAAEPWQQLSRPRRLRQFGDGHELDGFDDLPTSAQAESKFMKQPVARGNRTNARNKVYQSVVSSSSAPASLPYSPAKVEYQPHFARDTAASRMARESSLAQRAPATGPLTPLTSQRVAQVSTRPNLHPTASQNTIRAKKSKKPQMKPHLISNLNAVGETKVVNGMTYNPETFRWEGNENALNAFDVPTPSPSTATLAPSLLREKEGLTPRPLLITNMSASKGVKRVGDMIFDPQQMCWLKVDTTASSGKVEDPMDGFNAIDEDDDPFKDIPDLSDNKDSDSVDGGNGRLSELKDDWLVGEEFDVGPEFVRRQREEEERWRKKCEKWISNVERDNQAWRWAIRDIVMDL